MDETIALRVAGPADAAAISALTHAAYAKWIPVIGRLPMPMQADYADAVLKHRFDLLSVDETPAALIETVPQDGHLLIVNVAVHLAFQGRGFGVRLLRLAEDRAAADGLSGLRLYTNRRYAENLRLYGSLGYRVEREEAYGGNPDDIIVHMTKGFTSPPSRGWDMRPLPDHVMTLGSARPVRGAISPIDRAASTTGASTSATGRSSRPGADS